MKLQTLIFTYNTSDELVSDFFLKCVNSFKTVNNILMKTKQWPSKKKMN